MIEHCCFLAGLTNAKRSKKTENTESDIFPAVDADACRLQFSEKIANAFRNVLIQITEEKPLTDDGIVAVPAAIIGISNPLESAKLSK